MRRIHNNWKGKDADRFCSGLSPESCCQSKARPVTRTLHLSPVLWHCLQVFWSPDQCSLSLESLAVSSALVPDVGKNSTNVHVCPSNLGCVFHPAYSGTKKHSVLYHIFKVKNLIPTCRERPDFSYSWTYSLWAPLLGQQLERLQGHMGRNWTAWLQSKGWRSSPLPDRSAGRIPKRIF